MGAVFRGQGRQLGGQAMPFAVVVGTNVPCSNGYNGS